MALPGGGAFCACNGGIRLRHYTVQYGAKTIEFALVTWFLSVCFFCLLLFLVCLLFLFFCCLFALLLVCFICFVT